MKFSLLTLIVITTFAGLACAALAKPSDDWLIAVVTLTAVAFMYQVLRALVLSGARGPPLPAGCCSPQPTCC